MVISKAYWRGIRVGSGFLIVIFLVLAMLAFLEKHLIYFPTKYPEGDWNPSGLQFEDAWFEADDGTKLHGWYCPRENPRAHLVFAHGNAGNLSDRGPYVKFLCDQFGIAMLIFDYRGYGRSEGSPSEEGIYQDAKAARDWLAKRENLDPQEIVLFGRSLGGAAMVDLASKEGAKALILESTFSSAPDIAAHHYPFLPVRKMMKTRMDSISKIKNYHGPLLQCHGDADSVVPYKSGKKLFEAANDPKKFVTIPGGDHNNLPSQEYFKALNEFIESL